MLVTPLCYIVRAPPLRLRLGTDAVERIEAMLDLVRCELDKSLVDILLRRALGMASVVEEKDCAAACDAGGGDAGSCTEELLARVLDDATVARHALIAVGVNGDGQREDDAWRARKTEEAARGSCGNGRAGRNSSAGYRAHRCHPSGSDSGTRRCPKKPPLRIALLRVRRTVFIIAAFVFLTVLGLVRGDWWDLLFLAPAYATTLVIRLRKMYH